MISLFTIAIYQPFLNLLVFIYWLLSVITGGHADMGIAVIILTLIIRVLLLPISLAGDRSEKDRRAIASAINKLRDRYKGDPISFKKERKKVLKQSKKTLIGEVIGLSIQVTIALMLWKMFKTGLVGEDLNLIYSFIPEIKQPFNLVFLGKFDLSKTSFTLNLVQSFLILIYETIATFASSYPYTRSEVIRLQFTLPVISFLVFMALPSGKKLFVITSLVFSILLKIVQIVLRRIKAYKEGKDKAAAEVLVEEK